jgi:hypothetical protein
VATTVATAVTGRYLDRHHSHSLSAVAALTHGFQIGFYVLACLALLGAVLAAALIELPSPIPPPEPADLEPAPLEAA